MLALLFLILLIVASSLCHADDAPNDRCGAAAAERLFSITETPRPASSASQLAHRANLTSVADLTNNRLLCRHKASCAAFANTLLVVKLNPTRLLWLDSLLRFYSMGFPHIAFYAPLRKPSADEQAKQRDEMERHNSDGVGGDHHDSASDWTTATRRSDILLVGQHDLPVRLLDDNLGFVDVENVADAMQRFHTDFDGFLYISDDVLVEFWRLTQMDRTRFWRQNTARSNLKWTLNHEAVWKLTLKLFPDLKSVLDKSRPPFAATSGVFYVPLPRSSTVLSRMRRRRFDVISRVLLRYRAYNEFGTPFLLQCVDRDSYLPLKGKLVWGTKRTMLVKIPQRQYVWLHPVRASSELFARVSFALEEFVSSPKNQQDDADSALSPVAIDGSIFNEQCLNCATTADDSKRPMKGLLHSCAVAVGDCAKLCPAKPEEQAELIKTLWSKFGRGPHAAKMIAGRIYSPEARREVKCNLELGYEGFWNAVIVEEVFDRFYPHVNRTQMRSPSWGSEAPRLG